MKKYEYVTVKLKNNVVKDATLEEHRKVIDDYAAKGYSYAGYIPTRIGASGKIIEIDMIFEADER